MMTMTEEQKRLRRNNILLAVALGVFALLGVLIPYYYLKGMVVPG